LPAKVKAAKPVEDADLFTFSVEGDVTVASYDVSLRQIDTYEGETFALNQIARYSAMARRFSAPRGQNKQPIFSTIKHVIISML
jgi:hypothetical protein